MATIWKYSLKVDDEQIVEMPNEAQILCVQNQGGTPCLWALVPHPEAVKVLRRIRTYGTGHDVQSWTWLKYIGTYQLSGGALVFHVFEDHEPR